MSLDREFAASFVKDSEGFSEGHMKWWLRLSGEERQARLRQMVQPPREEPKVEIIPEEKEWPVWKWIELGLPTSRTADDFRKDFTASNPKLNINRYAGSIMNHKDFTISQGVLKLPLVLATVGDLGFIEQTQYQKICDRADHFGLDLCPAEAGLQLRRQYLDQPLGEWIVVAMKAIPDSGRGFSVFVVEHFDAGLWLGVCDGYPSDGFDLGDHFVFVPRKYQKPLDA